MYKSQIIKIANILTANYQRIQSYGLINGILGAVLFYYHYSRYIEYDEYEKMAGNLLDSVINQKSKKMPHAFSNGLYGLGWSIKYLIKEKFIDADSEVISIFDRMAYTKYSELEFQHDTKNCYPLFSKGLYSCILCDGVLQKQTLFSIKYILDNTDETEVKMSFLMSIIYFLLHYEITSEEMNMMASMKTKLITLIKKTLVAHSSQTKDLYILKMLLKEYGCNINLPICNCDIINDLYMNWQTIIYEDAVFLSDKINITSLNKIVEDYNFNIT